MMMKSVKTYGGASVANDVNCGQNFIGRDMISVTVQQETYLHQIWTRLDADLQDALALASNQVTREKGKTITLAHLLHALLRLQPELIDEITPLLRRYQMSQGTNQAVPEDDLPGSRQSIDVDAALRKTFAHLLEKRPAGWPLTYRELSAAFGVGRGQPCTGLLTQSLAQRPLIPFRRDSDCLANNRMGGAVIYLN
ncbi:MAG: hypothetical protein KDE58_23465 [Caldilineaceae bacterium]|nr:hypothetical protein [Caldilineaceae bacterium]